MINVKALTRLLTENADGKLFPRWLLMSPNGSLLAYTSPADIRELRDQVTLISMTWKEQIDVKRASLDHDDMKDALPSSSPIHTMTLEFGNRNILVRSLQPGLLLALEGGVPPGRSKQLQVMIEGPHDPRYPPDGATSGTATPNGQVGDHEPNSPSGHSAITTASVVRKRVNVLDLHRRKLDSMSDTLMRQFQEDGFEMPEDQEDRFF